MRPCVCGTVCGVSACAITPVGTEAAAGVLVAGGRGSSSIAICSAVAAYSDAAAIASVEDAAVATASAVMWRYVCNSSCT